MSNVGRRLMASSVATPASHDQYGKEEDVAIGGQAEVTDGAGGVGEANEGGGEDEGIDEGPGDAPGGTAEPTRPPTFLDFLKSPIVELDVGIGEDVTRLTAHQALLTRSPWFERACAEFPAEATRRRIQLGAEDLEAVSCLLEYLYTGDYVPRLRSQTLDKDPTVPEPDTEGIALLKHAKVYTLRCRMELPSLKSLAHSKIHRTSSTAKGEIAYARYVYEHSEADDATIRKPVAAFWATRSHVLRHEAEEEFRRMCLEFPQFGFDVLSLVLDQREKKETPRASQGTPSTEKMGRKRARLSQG